MTKFGGPEVLSPAQVPDPVAGEGEVVIGTEAADVLFLDTMIRGAGGGEAFPVRPPYVPGGGVAGGVLSVGPGVDFGLIGTTVVARLGGGGYAERAVVAADQVHPVPDALDPRVAVALLHDGVTALALAERTGIRSGERVLIIAAGRGEWKLARVREQGADVVIDYSAQGWAERVREATGGADLDVVLDGAGGQVGATAFAMIAPGGRFSVHGTPSGEFARVDRDEAARRGVTFWGIEAVQFTPDEHARLIDRVLLEAAAGRLRPVIGQTFPLAGAAEAHAVIESRAVLGKTLLLT